MMFVILVTHNVRKMGREEVHIGFWWVDLREEDHLKT
jgi:hypothetical protein